MKETVYHVIFILYGGDLSAAVARLLKRPGAPVVTTYAERSGRTRERAFGCDIEILLGLDDAVRESDVVMSFVLPTATPRRKRSITCAKAIP